MLSSLKPDKFSEKNPIKLLEKKKSSFKAFALYQN